MPISWTSLIDSAISFEVLTLVYPTKGNLVYEYNPFRNYRLNLSMFEYLGDYYTESQLYKSFNIIREGDEWKRGEAIVTDLITLHEKGELVDFITDELLFSLNHPVNIIPLYSYDGSVNLILNDGINVPRMINSRFSATGRNTYEVVDRKGNNDTNIYDRGEQFDIDTSLYKRVIKIPKIKFLGVTSGGNLKVGNYHLYFKLSDADGNETDFVGETGVISVFIGFNDPRSVTTGQANENSYKSILILITNIDTAYSYIYVYYSRYTAEADENFSTEYAKVDKKFIVNNGGVSTILFTGFEDQIPISAADINLNYNVIDSAVALTACQNMLFLGNVHKPDIPYKELLDLSLHFLPFLKLENYLVDMDENYYITTFNKGYYDPKFIYEKTGYWGEEIYRLGVVYIMPNDELSPVFNIRGADNIGEYASNDDSYNDGKYSNVAVYKEVNGQNVRNYILYSENDFHLYPDGDNIGTLNTSMENVKGVVRFRPTKDTNTIYGIDIRIDDPALQELKKYVKGYFFVRQSRIPTILAQGVTIGIDQNSYTPCVATADGYLTELSEQLEKTHVQSEDINDVNYVSEGFISRYSFKFEKKSSGLFGSILTGVLIGVGVVALAAATVFTCGAALGAAGVVAGGALAAGASAVGAAVGTAAGLIAGVTGIGLGTLALGATAVVATVAVGTAATIAALGAIQEVRYMVGRAFAKKKLDGRNTVCPSGYKIVETDESRKLTLDFFERIIIKDPSKVKVQAILCPDYEVNQGYYNSIFTGNTHKIGLTNTQCTNGLIGHSSNYFTNDERHFYIPAYYDMGIRNSYDFKIVGVPDGVSLTGIDNLKFRSKAGQAEEAWRYECVGDDYKSDYSRSSNVEDEDTISNKLINSDIIRGEFGPYLAFNDEHNKFSPAETVNIYIPEYNYANMDKYFQIRMLDSTPFSAISDRYDINNSDENLVKPLSIVTSAAVNRSCGYRHEVYRGDCYICQFTHRMHRNFQDPGAPFNDEIVQDNTWKDNYDTSEPEKYQQINLGDVNAIQIGTWVTFRVRSSYNLNIRTLDSSDVTESGMTGHPKGYYPYLDMFVEGTYKHSDSAIYNKGFSKSLSERFNMELPDVPHIKNWFGTRIMYSDIHINDAYKNGYRVFRPTAYRDYTREYGEIVKLLTLESDIICVFEHGVARIPVNKAAVAQQIASGANLVTTSNVLPEAPIILSDMFGSQWADSVLKTPGKIGNAKLYIYGVDTIAKKIWRTDGQSLECISDMKVQEFLNNNITLGERENTPILGVRNVKTCYNSFKRDVMFTFYDNTYGFEEKVWNLCWSELLEKFITFYSWVPSFMEDINNVPFSFDRNVSKWIAKLGTSHADNSFADGITLTNTVIGNYGDVSAGYNFSYKTKNGTIKTVSETVDDITRFIGVLGIANRILPDNLFYTVKYKLARDIWGNYKHFEIKKITDITLPTDSMFYKEDRSFPIYGLYFKEGHSLDDLMSELYYRNEANITYADFDDNHKIKDLTSRTHPIFKDRAGRRVMLPRNELKNPDGVVTLLNISASITIESTGNTNEIGDAYHNMKASYSSDTILIGAATYESTVGLTTKWNTQFLTSDFWKHGQAGIIDIKDNIFPTYWYGKQHPFEFECVVVDDPSLHKIFTNLELVANKAKPESFHYEVVGETYDFARDKVNMYFRQEALKALWQYNGEDITYDRNFLKVQPRQLNRSADLIHRYYTRLDTINDIEDYYIHVTYPKGYDYRHLSGAEIVYYPTRQEFRVWNHTMAVDLNDLSQDDARSIIAGNCQYLEDRWKVTINPILVCYKNEFYKDYKDVNDTKPLIHPDHSTWAKAKGSDLKLPTLLIFNSPIPDAIKASDGITIPGSNPNVPPTEDERSNALYNLYDLTNFGINGNYSPLDTTNWLNDVDIYRYNFGEAHNRKEIDVRDKFVKIRIRYSGEELAIIDFLNTIYLVSYA